MDFQRYAHSDAPIEKPLNGIDLVPHLAFLISVEPLKSIICLNLKLDHVLATKEKNSVAFLSYKNKPNLIKIVVNLTVLEYSFVDMHKMSLEILHQMGHMSNNQFGENSPLTDSLDQSNVTKTSFRDKLVGALPSAYAKAFDFVNQMDEDLNSSDEDVEAHNMHRQGMAAVKLSKETKGRIRKPWS
nr:hypothetical protein CFP56_29018 [Quercus suber]